MLKKLLLLSLIALPFYEIILYFFIPSRSYPTFQDMRITKDFTAQLFSIVIGARVLYQYGFNRIRNIWIPSFLLFLIFSIHKAPRTNLMLNGAWNYKPVFQIFAYYFLFLGVKNMNLSRKDIEHIYKVMLYCGLGTAIYMIFQYFGYDQVLAVVLQGPHDATKNPNIGGCLGQPTLAAPFLVLTSPFAIRFKKWFSFLTLITAIILSGSSVAIAGLGVVIALSIIFSAKNKALTIGIILLISIPSAFYLAKNNPDLLNANGRYAVWQDVAKEIKEGKIAFSGAGIGAFPYLYALRNGNTWTEAHNDYLQLIWGCGIIGFSIFMLMAKDFIKRILCDKTLLISIAGISVIALGTFVFQLAVYQYYITVLLAIGYISSQLKTEEK